MRKIDTIVVHHSATPKSVGMQKSITSFNNSHKRRFADKYRKGKPSQRGYFIEYHNVIGPDGENLKTRNHNEVAYHAANLPMNKKSIGICLVGNFDEEHPNRKQYDKLSREIARLKETYQIKNVIGHRDVVGVYKSCPGKNFLFEKIMEMGTDKDILVDMLEAVTAQCRAMHKMFYANEIKDILDELAGLAKVAREKITDFGETPRN